MGETCLAGTRELAHLLERNTECVTTGLFSPVELEAPGVYVGPEQEVQSVRRGTRRTAKFKAVGRRRD